MPGPPPKQAARQRRNRNTQALSAPSKVDVPPLPEIEGGWHPLTAAWWADIWASEMAGQWIASDVHGLYILAALVDQYWQHPSTALATEIRLQRACFGLDTYARRRLDWKIAPPETTAPARASGGKSSEGGDPRAYLES